MKIVTTMWADWHDAWTSGTQLVDARRMGKFRLWKELYKAAKTSDVVIVNGALGARQMYRDLIGALLIRTLRRQPNILIVDATWEPQSRTIAKIPFGQQLSEALSWVFMTLLDAPNVHYCVLSSFEQERFPKVWGVEPRRVHFTRYPYTVDEDIEIEPEGDGTVFAGGDSLRDYDLLIEAARRINAQVVIASRQFESSGNVPPNIHVVSLSHAEFVERMRTSSVAVVPLRKSVRSAGQQTYLNSLRMGVPTIVTDVPGVQDYKISNNALVIVPSEPEAMADAITEALKRGRINVDLSDCTVEKYWCDLLGTAIQTLKPKNISAT